MSPAIFHILSSLVNVLNTESPIDDFKETAKVTGPKKQESLNHTEKVIC